MSLRGSLMHRSHHSVFTFVTLGFAFAIACGPQAHRSSRGSTMTTITTTAVLEPVPAVSVERFPAARSPAERQPAAPSAERQPAALRRNGNRRTFGGTATGGVSGTPATGGALPTGGTPATGGTAGVGISGASGSAGTPGGAGTGAQRLATPTFVARPTASFARRQPRRLLARLCLRPAATPEACSPR